MKPIITLFLLSFWAKSAAAQDTAIDSLHTPQVLPEATVRAFELASAAQSIPASIGIVSDNLLRRYSNASIVQAVNIIPGVRMEERSPGSYRLAIRGSSLRAPFGVRNVKIYYNGIPFTDPGGNTYLTQLGYYNFSRLELIKGPGSSLYGAGTGGVVLMESIPTKMQRGFGVEATAGSYGLLNLEAEARTLDSSGRLRSIFRYQHLTSEGYRQHSALRRDVASWDADAKLSASTSLSIHAIYTDLNYETPGALTLAEYEANPKNARPAAGPSPSATTAGASVAQKAFLIGGGLTHAVNERWSFTTTLYGAFTAQENPSLRNYTRSSEPHAGGRAMLKYSQQRKQSRLEWLLGAEAQQGLVSAQTFGNRGGSPDTLQSDEKLTNHAAFAFTQASLNWRHWLLTAGVSLNSYRMRYGRLNIRPYNESLRDFSSEAAPRIAASYRWNDAAAIYASVSRGFSPPTSSELSPTGGILNNDLNAESGWNYESGVRGSLLSERLSYDVAVYYFALSNTIVQRRDAAGGDYYINSGSTEQIGTEAALRWHILDAAISRIGDVAAFASYSFQHYRYKDFRQIDQDFSGNAMPGVSPNTISAGIDWTSRFGLYARLSYFYADITPLNDAGDAALHSYHLFGARIGFKIPREGQYGIDAFVGGENLADVRYSSGPDINGFGGRYYNAAPGRNFYAGIALQRAR